MRAQAQHDTFSRPTGRGAICKICNIQESFKSHGRVLGNLNYLRDSYALYQVGFVFAFPHLDPLCFELLRRKGAVGNMRANELLCPSNQVGQCVTPHYHDLGKHVSFERLTEHLCICYFGDSTHNWHILASFILHRFLNSRDTFTPFFISFQTLRDTFTRCYAASLRNKGTRNITAASRRLRYTSKISSFHISRIVLKPLLQYERRNMACKASLSALPLRLPDVLRLCSRLCEVSRLRLK